MHAQAPLPITFALVAGLLGACSGSREGDARSGAGGSRSAPDAASMAVTDGAGSAPVVGTGGKAAGGSGVDAAASSAEMGTSGTSASGTGGAAGTTGGAAGASAGECTPLGSPCDSGGDAAGSNCCDGECVSQGCVFGSHAMACTYTCSLCPMGTCVPPVPAGAGCEPPGGPLGNGCCACGADGRCSRTCRSSGGGDESDAGPAEAGDAAAGYCGLPCTGPAPDPAVATACYELKTEAGCTAFTASEFPYECAWIVPPVAPCLVP